jgi:cobalt-zinc-cadmium efflux system outer membrane protein
MARIARCLLIAIPLMAVGCATLPWESATLAPPVATVNDAVQLASFQQLVQETPHKAETQPAKDMANGQEKKPAVKISLPQAIQMCVAQNFRLRIGAEKVREAEGDLLTASLIPNASLFTDYQLIPLQQANISNQLGPPQADAIVTVPIDWLLFGKRVAAMQAARLGVDVSSADYADVHRVQVGRTVGAFYTILANEKYLKHVEEYLAELEALQKLTDELAATKKVGKIEIDRIKLAVLEVFLEKHDRERAFEVSKAQLRPLIGLPPDVEIEAEGVLDIPTRVVPPPKLAEAIALAEAHRPDLISDRFDIDRARANVEVERRKAHPLVSISPGWTYQNQHAITGFRNGSMFDIGLNTTLPFTDRNQGNIMKARALEAEAHHTYMADRADVFAEVETAVLNFEDAVEHLGFNSPETLKAAYALRSQMEAAYRNGTRSLQEMLLAQQAYRDRLAHVIEFASDYYHMLNKLNMAVGLNAYDVEKAALPRDKK